MQKSTLAQRIRAARKRKELTQLTVAKKLGIDRSAVTMWESINPNVSTRPDLSRLEAFGRLTETPLWWLLSDESDPTQPWPVVTEENPSTTEKGANAMVHFVRAFWSAVSLRCREQRSDLWDADIWDPRGPAWLQPLTPDVLTPRSAVELLAMAKPSFARIAQAMSHLVAFEQASQRVFKVKHERLVVLIWLPESESYTDECDRLYEQAQTLAQATGVTYYTVKDENEATAYLLQIL